MFLKSVRSDMAIFRIISLDGKEQLRRNISIESGENIVVLKQMIFEAVKRKHLHLYPNFLKEGGYEFSPWPTEQVREVSPTLSS